MEKKPWWEVEAKIGPRWIKQIGPEHSFELTKEQANNLVYQLKDLQKRPQLNIEKIRVKKF